MLSKMIKINKITFFFLFRFKRNRGIHNSKKSCGKKFSKSIKVAFLTKNFTVKFDLCR